MVVLCASYAPMYVCVCPRARARMRVLRLSDGQHLEGHHLCGSPRAACNIREWISTAKTAAAPNRDFDRAVSVLEYLSAPGGASSGHAINGGDAVVFREARFIRQPSSQHHRHIDQHLLLVAGLGLRLGDEGDAALCVEAWLVNIHERRGRRKVSILLRGGGVRSIRLFGRPWPLYDQGGRRCMDSRQPRVRMLRRIIMAAIANVATVNVDP